MIDSTVKSLRIFSAVNTQLLNAAGRRRMFASPHCKQAINGMKSWPNKLGIPHRRSQFAHVCDAVSYVIYRFFGRPKAGGEPSKYVPLNLFDRGALFR
jgi:hypothetical protein